LLLECFSLLLVLSDLCLLNVLRQDLIVELLRVLHSVLVVDLTTVWLHDVTLLRVSEILKVVVLTLTEVLLEHCLVLDSGILLSDESLTWGLMARQVVMVVVIHNGEEIFIRDRSALRLGSIFLLHQSIKLRLNVRSVLVNLAATLLEVSSDGNLLLLGEIS